MTASTASPAGALSRRSLLTVASALAATASTLKSSAAKAGERDAPLPSWRTGPAKQAILAFVRATTERSSAGFVPPDDRIATFDQDGTLWVEHPLYTQAMFALYRVHVLAPRHAEWHDAEPFKSVLSGDREALGKFTEHDWFEIIAATHAGMTSDAFPALVQPWLAAAKDPRFRRPFTELVYQPMREVMEFLRANGFKTYIVTGGGQDFVRVYSQRVYGVPPEQVIGAVDQTQYQMEDGKAILMRLPKVAFIDDGDGKPIGIERVIGKRPYAAFGNSDGDRAMLEWTAAGDGPRLKMLVHHDDAQREYAYGPGGGLPDTKVGTFSEALMTRATSSGWSVLSMKNDWSRVFAFDGE
jgi:phosphoglycolate phosphatase-like HAD superfamily hydrolase